MAGLVITIECLESGTHIVLFSAIMGRLLVPLFASTLFLTSALLSVLEPLVAKGLLPVLGGGAAVWTTSVAFFQLALLAGYLYAHLAPSWLPPRRHAAVHVALLAAAAIALPLRAPAGLVAPASHQAIWLFGRLAVSIGPAFVLLAATAPLVQRWLASTGHRDARDPSFLYVSNERLLALAAYPVLLEPLAGLDRQRRLWMGGLALAVVLLATSAAAAWRAGLARNESSGDGGARAADPRVPASLRLRWLVLAAVPSSLLLGVTDVSHDRRRGRAVALGSAAGALPAHVRDRSSGVQAAFRRA